MYRVSELVVARMPALPVEIALGVFGAADPLEALRTLLRDDGSVREAIATASPSLVQAIDAWLAGAAPRNDKAPLRALAYLIRMSARTTPFGTCAGVGVVEIGERTALALRDDAWSRSVRPDMGCVFDLVQAIERDASLRAQLTYVTNECAIERGGRLYVTNLQLMDRREREGTLFAAQRPVSLKLTDAVRFARGICSSGARYSELCEALAERFAAPLEGAERLASQLVTAGVLVSELRPAPLGDPWRQIAGRLRELGIEPDDEPALAERPPQIDLHARVDGTLGRAVLAEIARYVELTMRLSPPSLLKNAHEAFQTRYEGTERLVPLLELVDDNLGLGVMTDVALQPMTAAQEMLLVRLASEAAAFGLEEVELGERELATLAPPLNPGAQPLPAFEAGVKIVAASPEAVDRGEFRIVPGACTFSDAPLKSIGRFLHVLPSDVRERAAAIANAGADPGVVRAELVFPPSDARAYNVAIRPLLYDKQIRLCTGEPADDTTMALADLYVGIENDRFFLWSESLGRRVEVRETHAFGTPFNAPELCRFLALLRYDLCRAPREFSWGPAARNTYLPRVRAGRIVLAPRRWSFAREGFDLGRERARWRIPRYVYLVDDDRQLLVDLESSVAAALLDDQCAGLPSVTLVEALDVEGGTWVAGTRGTHVAEFMVQAAADAAPARALRPVEAFPAVRSFGPGSPWTYAKLYTGAQAADYVLHAHVAPLVARLRETGALQAWFFVRYADPRYHLRLRLQAAPGAELDVRDAVCDLGTTLLAAQAVSRFALDTYEPELERYGGPSLIDTAHRWFTLDSEAVLGELAAGAAGTAGLVAAAVRSLDPYLQGAPMARLAVEALAPSEQRKLSEEDRALLRALQPALAPDGAEILAALVRGFGGAKRLADLVHMRCNRLGIDAPAEPRVYAVLRAAALGRLARKKEEREPHIAGSRS